MNVSISRDLIDSNISYDEFVLINNLLKEHDDMNEEIKNLKNSLQICTKMLLSKC